MDNFAHSHIKNYKSCLWLIDLSIKKKCPYDIPKYFVVSLIRINNDKKYLNLLNNILKKKNIKHNYYNVNHGRK